MSVSLSRACKQTNEFRQFDVQIFVAHSNSVRAVDWVMERRASAIERDAYVAVSCDYEIA